MYNKHNQAGWHLNLRYCSHTVCLPQALLQSEAACCKLFKLTICSVSTDFHCATGLDQVQVVYMASCTSMHTVDVLALILALTEITQTLMLVLLLQVLVSVQTLACTERQVTNCLFSSVISVLYMLQRLYAAVDLSSASQFMLLVNQPFKVLCGFTECLQTTA
jgi:hypothetical protein